ncbi:MAG: hypothetical protein WCI04_07215 [archaeon]
MSYVLAKMINGQIRQRTPERQVIAALTRAILHNFSAEHLKIDHS